MRSYFSLALLSSVSAFVPPAPLVEVGQRASTVQLFAKPDRPDMFANYTTALTPARLRLQQWGIPRPILLYHEIWLNSLLTMSAFQLSLMLKVIDALKPPAKQSDISVEVEDEREERGGDADSSRNSTVAMSHSRANVTAVAEPIIKEKIINRVEHRKEIDVQRVKDKALIKRVPVVIPETVVEDVEETTHDLGTKRIDYKPASKNAPPPPRNETSTTQVIDEHFDTEDMSVTDSETVHEEEEIQPIIERTVVRPRLVKEKRKVIRVDHSSDYEES